MVSDPDLTAITFTPKTARSSWSRFRSGSPKDALRSMGLLSRQAIERNPPEGKVRRTDLGIAIAHAVSPKRRRWTLDEIALFAGVTESSIVLIEQKALRKLRKKLNDPLVRELVSHYIS